MVVTLSESDDGVQAAVPRAAAFFDLDNTMIRGASIFHFARGLAMRKAFTPREVATFTWQQLRYRVLGRENARDIDRARDTALRFVAGRRVADIVEVGEQIYDELVAERVWQAAVSLARTHLDAGQPVWLVTATPVELALIISRRLGLTGALGTIAESTDGVYTGRLVGHLMHGAAKADAVRRLAERENLSLSESCAYSDSSNDLPLLSSVGHPFAVNPDRSLRRHAEAQGWPVLDFRSRRWVRRGTSTG